MSEQEPTGVREVREWRRQVARDLEGKTWAEIVEHLNRRLAQYERQREAYWEAQKTSDDPAA